LDTLSNLFQFGVLAPLGVVAVALLLILIHELGHFAAGRYFGVGVEEFSIGFGPVVFARYDARGTRWSLRALPLGGFVKFAGDADATSRPGGAHHEDTNQMALRQQALAQFPIW